MNRIKKFFSPAFILMAVLLVTKTALAGEADINLPDLKAVTFNLFGHDVLGLSLMHWGLAVCAIGMIFGIIQYKQTKALPVLSEMKNVSQIIWETCKTYLTQQGKFLAILWVLIGACMVYYFAVLNHKSAFEVSIILAASLLGIAGSYGVAWFGIRINTVANSRTSFASLYRNPMGVLAIPLQSGMSVGLLLVSVELFFI